MNEAHVCPDCGANLAAETPESLCPKCLLQAGLASSDDASSSREDPTLVTQASPTNTDKVGTVVRYFGDYELLEEIARGGMGIVYKARQTNLNRTVALKMILAGQMAGEQDVQRFYIEAEAAARLHHPNIVAIHEVGEHNGEHYFSMDYVDGPNLSEVVLQKPLTAQKAAVYLKTIAEAIHYAHEQGTLHRDLKPSNILIDRKDQPRITDFGLAKRIEGDPQLTATGSVLGTPSYMPPEQAAAKRGLIGPTSDVYSLGAVLYHVLTGQPPFQAETALDTLLLVIDSDPVQPQTLNPKIPVDLATICLKCLAKRPEHRYLTAQELADDLGRFLDYEPIEARPASSARRAWSWTKRHPWAITAVALLVVFGLLSVVYWLWAENSYLRWTVDHPDHKKEPGPNSSFLEQMFDISLFAWLGIMFAQANLTRQSNMHRREGRAIPSGWLALFAITGVAGIVWGFFVAMKNLDAYVWEGHSLLHGFVWTYVCCYFGAVVLIQTLRELERSTFGAPDEVATLSSDQRTELKRILMNKDRWHEKKILRAIMYYRAETGAKLGEAKNTIDDLLAEIHSKHPDEVPPVLDPIELMTPIFKSVMMLSIFALGLFLAVMAFAGLGSGDPYSVAGLAGFVAAAGVATIYRSQGRWFTPGQFVFAALLIAPLSVLVIYRPIVPIVIGALIGMTLGVALVMILVKKQLDRETPAVNWRRRYWKAVLMGAIGGLVVGILPGVVFLGLGSEIEDTNAALLLFVAVPLTTAASLSILAMGAMASLKYLDWLTGGSLSRSQKSKGD
ncbi:MAG: protein kinase [Pirellulaceae bacterium]